MLAMLVEGWGDEWNLHDECIKNSATLAEFKRKLLTSIGPDTKIHVRIF